MLRCCKRWFDQQNFPHCLRPDRWGRIFTWFWTCDTNMQACSSICYVKDNLSISGLSWHSHLIPDSQMGQSPQNDYKQVTVRSHTGLFHVIGQILAEGGRGLSHHQNHSLHSCQRSQSVADHFCRSCTEEGLPQSSWKICRINPCSAHRKRFVAVVNLVVWAYSLSECRRMLQVRKCMRFFALLARPEACCTRAWSWDIA